MGGEVLSPHRVLPMIRSHSDRGDRGVVALELVLTLPVLIMLVFGAVVLGNYLSVKTQTVGLARDGARAAALRQSLPADTQIVGAACSDPADPNSYVTVEATKTVSLRGIPFLPSVLPEEVTETVSMRCGG